MTARPVPAASPDEGEAAALMSSRHAWLRFRSTGVPLSGRLDADPGRWQEAVLLGHRRWFGPQAPTQVAGALVLQYLLQVPAHAAAFAAGAGMRVGRLRAVTFESDGGGVPRIVELGRLERAGDGGLEAWLTRAEADYREVADPLAAAYLSTRRMSTHQRTGMVGDMWTEAARAVRGSVGAFTLGEPRRVSCCLVYALPGCTECVACPRLGR